MRLLLQTVLCLCFALLPGGPAAMAETVVPRTAAELAMSFAPVVRQTAPAVVNIFTRRITKTRTSPFMNDPFFGQFFQGLERDTTQVQGALGSGVIVGPDGIVLSNYHVVEGATEIRVVLLDRREFPAQVILADQDSDLAVLRLEGAKDLPALAFDDSDALQVGDLVLAIGNPFGVGQTVSSGIVSGLARSALQVGDGRGYYVQTDAPINPGNSGGALVDMNGRLVGINTAILTKDGGSNGIGFAIPSNLAAAILAKALAGESQFERPWAGVSAQAMDAATAALLGLALPEGVLLSDLHPASPFARAGLRRGDAVLSLGGFAVNTPQEMNYRLAILGVGATVPVRYQQDGAARTAMVTLSAAPEDPPRNTLILSDTSILPGLTLSQINPAVIAALRLPLSAQGVVVANAPEAALRLGLAPADIIVAVNGTVTPTPADVADAFAQPARRWSLDIIRQGQLLSLRFRL